MLKFPGEWKFAPVEEIPPVSGAVSAYFHDALTRIAKSAEGPKGALEVFKSHFGAAGHSSNEDWAITDLRSAMQEDGLNAVGFLDALWTCLETARSEGLPVPTVEQVNTILRRNNVGYELRPPDLIRVTADAVVAAAPGGDGGGERYAIGERIGGGGFGEVFVATKQTSAATFEFALKRLYPSPFADADKARERFRREVSALQALQHRGIVSFVDAGVDQDGRPYVVMPLVRGMNIRDWSEGRAQRDTMLAVVEVLGALEYAHANGVLHRDLKPSNILVRDSDQQPLILDFGNAYILDELDQASLTSTVVGSIGYIPPEVLADPKVRSPLQDVYAAAVLTYELIARRRPNPLEYEPLQPAFSTPAALDATIRRALGPAGQRPQTVAILRREFAAIAF